MDEPILLLLSINNFIIGSPVKSVSQNKGAKIPMVNLKNMVYLKGCNNFY